MKKKSSENPKSRFIFIVTLSTFLLLFLIVISMFLAGNYLQKTTNLAGYATGSCSKDNDGPNLAKCKEACVYPHHNCEPTGETNCNKESIYACKPDFTYCLKNINCHNKEVKYNGMKINCETQECYCKKVDYSFYIGGNYRIYKPTICVPDKRPECVDYKKITHEFPVFISDNLNGAPYYILGKVVKDQLDKEGKRGRTSDECDRSLYLFDDVLGKTVKATNDLNDVPNMLDFESNELNKVVSGAIKNKENPTSDELRIQKSYLDEHRCCWVGCSKVSKAELINKSIYTAIANAEYKFSKEWNEIDLEEKEKIIRPLVTSSGITLNNACVFCNIGGNKYASGTCVGNMKISTIWALMGVGLGIDSAVVVTSGSETHSSSCVQIRDNEDTHYQGMAFDLRNRDTLGYPEFHGYKLLDRLIDVKITDSSIVNQFGFPRIAITKIIDETKKQNNSNVHVEVNQGFLNDEDDFDWECQQTIHNEIPIKTKITKTTCSTYSGDYPCYYFK